MRIDLHCHSTHSDGSLAARDVAERAFAREVAVFCLTDHDSCDGFAATQAAYPRALQGVELSCTHDDRTVHLLVYKRPSSKTWNLMEEALRAQQAVRRTRVHQIQERLQAVDVALDADALLAKHQNITIGRPHIAAELVRTGVVNSRAEAFDRYLKDGGPGDVKVGRLSLAEGLSLGRAAGGCMSLAHPHVHGTRAEGLLRAHKDQGLAALEVYYGQYKKKARKNWADLALQLGLLSTAGSDFHGEGLPQITKLGVDMPDNLAEPLLDWLEFSVTS